MLVDRYCIIDLETTGPVSSIHRVLLFGLLYTRNGSANVTDNTPIDLYVSTPYSPAVWGAIYLRQDFMDLFVKYQPWTKAVQDEIDDNNGSIMGTSVPKDIQDFEEKGKKKFICAYDIHKISAKTCQDRGVDRSEALGILHGILSDVKKDKVWLVGHNIVRFDIPFIQAEFNRYGYSWDPDPDYIIDTGAIVKARQINVHPRPNERNIDYYRRAANARAKGVQWSLDKHCVPTYNLEKLGVDVNRQHTSAGYDCFVTHCLLQAL